MQPETRYAKSGDYSIAYQVVGDGPIDLVLAPGFISNVHALLERRQLLDRHRIGQAGAALVEADEPRERRKAREHLRLQRIVQAPSTERSAEIPQRRCAQGAGAISGVRH